MEKKKRFTIMELNSQNSFVIKGEKSPLHKSMEGAVILKPELEKQWLR